MPLQSDLFLNYLRIHNLHNFGHTFLNRWYSLECWLLFWSCFDCNAFKSWKDPKQKTFAGNKLVYSCLAQMVCVYFACCLCKSVTSIVSLPVPASPIPAILQFIRKHLNKKLWLVMGWLASRHENVHQFGEMDYV